MSANQREFTRVKTVIPVEIRHPGGSLSATSQDVSLNGIFVRCASPLPAQAQVQVRLHLDPVVIEAEGTVVRSGLAGIAIRFDELHEIDSYEHLRNLILYNAADPAAAEQEFDSHLGLKRCDPLAPPPQG